MAVQTLAPNETRGWEQPVRPVVHLHLDDADFDDDADEYDYARDEPGYQVSAIFLSSSLSTPSSSRPNFVASRFIISYFLVVF